MGFWGSLQDKMLAEHDKQLRTNDVYQLSTALHPERYDAMERMRARREKERRSESHSRFISASKSNQSSNGGAWLALGTLALVGWGAKKMWDFFTSKDNDNKQADSIPVLQEKNTSKD